ncbi:acyltransferase family protein [Formosa sp. S-31]|uniref:acyltransferase family protein n=1 Tax=Formosa sp. S-31 TaxID=2790949 RepID=UPI003EB91988
MNQQIKRKRLVELDGLRGIAAVSVVLYHYTSMYNTLYGHEGLLGKYNFSIGSHGVQLFFMISGFVIFLSLNHLKRPMDFVVSRFSRLYPPYWVAIACTFSVVYLFGLPGRQFSPITALKNMSMLQGYFKVSSIDGVYWTLKVELTFYFWMFISYLFNGLKKIELFLILLMFMNVFVYFADINLVVQLRDALLFSHLPFFAIGICLFKIFYKEYNQLTIATLILALSVILLLYSVKLFILYLSFTIIFYFGIKGKISVLSSKVLVFIGSISYSLYLLHQNIGYVIINKGYEIGINPLISVFFAAIIVTVISYISYKLIELPSSKIIRKFYKNIRFKFQLESNKSNDSTLYSK